MQILSSEKQKKVLVVAETIEDARAIKWFWDNKMIHGMYLIWLDNKEKKGKEYEEIKTILVRFPEARGILMLSMPNNFIPVISREDMKKNMDSSIEEFNVVNEEPSLFGA